MGHWVQRSLVIGHWSLGAVCGHRFFAVVIVVVVVIVFFRIQENSSITITTTVPLRATDNEHDRSRKP